MKTKAKLMLGISVMTAAVLAAGVTSTFAWLTTQSKATLTTGTMTVGTVSDIKITVWKLGFEDTYPPAPAPQPTNFGNETNDARDIGQPLGVVSSVDGDKFYAPTALHETDDYAAGDMAEVTTKSAWGTKSNGFVGYMKYGIHVAADADTGGARTLKFKITIPDTVTDPDILASYRVALLNATHDTNLNTWTAGTKVGIYSNDGAEKDGWKYVTSPSTAFTTGKYDTDEISTVATAQSLGVTTSSAIEKDYIFSIWIEGEDPAATNAGVSGASLKVDLEFSLA